MYHDETLNDGLFVNNRKKSDPTVGLDLILLHQAIASKLLHCLSRLRMQRGEKRDPSFVFSGGHREIVNAAFNACPLPYLSYTCNKLFATFVVPI